MLGTKYEGFDRLSIYHDQRLYAANLHILFRDKDTYLSLGDPVIVTKVRVGFKKLLTKVFVTHLYLKFAFASP